MHSDLNTTLSQYSPRFNVEFNNLRPFQEWSREFPSLFRHFPGCDVKISKIWKKKRFDWSFSSAGKSSKRAERSFSVVMIRPNQIQRETNGTSALENEFGWIRSRPLSLAEDVEILRENEMTRDITRVNSGSYPWPKLQLLIPNNNCLND